MFLPVTKSSPGVSWLCSSIDKAHYAVQSAFMCTVAFEPWALESGGAERSQRSHSHCELKYLKPRVEMSFDFVPSCSPCSTPSMKSAEPT